MPEETRDAIAWALLQDGVKQGEYIDNNLLVDAVREFFERNSVDCPPMNFYDLKPFL